MEKIALATVWLEGCSGCHMSFLDLDEWLVELAAKVDLVYSPFTDVKIYPEGVTVALVEGGIGNRDQLELIQRIRANTELVVAFGDCAITSNVPGMRNRLGSAEPVLRRSYVEGVECHPGIPQAQGLVPELLNQVMPVHTVIPVDSFLPGCPPPAARIRMILESLLDGRIPELQGRDLKFG